MKKADIQCNLRIPARLKESLKVAAKKNRRSMTAELVARLEASFGELGDAAEETDPNELKPCPFCGQPLEERRTKYNPSARCVTPDCMGGKLPLISLDLPEDIERWNRRATNQEVANG